MAKEDKKNLISRPPVVVVLGHVDHGKSSILEKIKDLKITAKESGGITQHIGAYEIEHPSPDSGQVKKITFIDTPGHEAFETMRSRGAKVADIAVLVIAAEEGIKPQTKEVISHIKEAKIPMIIAINKIDKPGADAEKVKRELLSQEISVESMGGKIPCIETSAETGQGIGELLEMVLLLAEMEDLKGDISKPAQGIIVESHLDSRRGPTTTLILQSGILKKGDILATNSAVGKIRIMENYREDSIDQAMPSMPVVIIGFETVPDVGEEFKIFSNIEDARKEIKKPKKIVFEKSKEGQRILKIILKADVLGSIEAIEKVLNDIPQEKAIIQMLKAGVGEINDSDVKLAKSSGAKIIGFRTKANKTAQKLALREKITIITFNVIYELANTIRQALEKKVAHEIVRNDLGKIKILAIFKTDKNSQIIGGKVIDGEIKRGANLEVFRDEELIGKGKIVKLQKDKKDIGEVGKGSECGILYQGDIEIQEDDVLHVYIEEKVKGEL